MEVERTRMTKLFAALLIGLFSQAASASDWWFVSEASSKPFRRLTFVDKSSMQTVGTGSVKAWEYRIQESLDKDGVRKSKVLHKYDCSNRTSTLLSIADYGNNDKLVYSHSWNLYEQSADELIPDTVGETVWRFVCEADFPGAHELNNITPEQFSATYFKISK